MSNTIAIIAASTSAAASVAAQQAKETACKGFVETFDSTKASIEKIKEYADCVNLLYPGAMTSSDVLHLKLFIVFCFCGGLYGIFHTYKEEYNPSAGDYFVGFGVGVLAAVCVGVLSALFFGAIYFVVMG